MEEKKALRRLDTERFCFFINPREEILLKEPEPSEEYAEAYLKPDKQPASGHCDNTTTYDS